MATRETSKKKLPAQAPNLRLKPVRGGNLAGNVLHDEAEGDGGAAVFVGHGELEEFKSFKAVCGVYKDSDGVGGWGGCQDFGLVGATANQCGEARDDGDGQEQGLPVFARHVSRVKSLEFQGWGHVIATDSGAPQYSGVNHYRPC